MSNNNIITPNEKKPSLLWSFIKQLTLALFPGIRLLKINKGLKRANKFYKHDWFIKQKRRNTLVSILVSLPFLITLGLMIVSIYNAETFWMYLSKARNNFSGGQFKLGLEYVAKSFTAASGTDISLISRLNVMGRILLSGMGVSFLFGTIIMIFHPLIRETKILYQMLQKNGVIDKDDHSRLVLATPLGFLIDITGNTAKELKDSDRIWMALNQKVTDWAEDPEQRAICFFKKSYNLKHSYMYSFGKPKKK